MSPWAGLVAEMHAVKLSSYPLDDAAHAGIRRSHLTPKSDLSLPTGFSNVNRILQFGDINPTKASIIYHGSSSCDEDRLGLSEQPSDDQCRANHLTHEDGHTVSPSAFKWNSKVAQSRRSLSSREKADFISNKTPPGRMKERIR